MTFSKIQGVLKDHLSESRRPLIQLLAGPRQVGKTTLLLALLKEFGEQAAYVSFDSPAAEFPGLWERTWAQAQTRGEKLGRTMLLLDEIQHLEDWGTRLKGEWDRVVRLNLPLAVVASGSSSFRLGGGLHKLTGRFERLTLGHWPAGEIASIFDIESAQAAELYVRLGSYPGSMSFRKDRPRFLSYVRDSIVNPSLSRDALASETGIRRPALLRQLLAICAGSPAAVESLNKLRGQMTERGALDTLASYLEVLEDSFLIAPIRKYAFNEIRSRKAPAKLIALNNALLAALDPQGPPERAREPARFGAWVENACLASARNAEQQVYYWREGPLEVDAVVEGEWGRWAIEVKSGAFDSTGLRGLMEFSKRHRRFQPLVLCDPDYRMVADRLGIAALDWRWFLIHGIPPDLA